MIIARETPMGVMTHIQNKHQNIPLKFISGISNAIRRLTSFDMQNLKSREKRLQPDFCLSKVVLSNFWWSIIKYICISKTPNEVLGKVELKI